MVSDTRPTDSANPNRFSAYAWGVLAFAAVTAVACPVEDRLDHADIVMVYLLVVALVAMNLGRNPAIAAAVVSVLLIASEGRVLTHRQILREIWGAGHVDSNPYQRVCVGNLCRKLEADSARPRHILTETGVGYRFVR